jgi:hypothetical protein
LGFTLVSPNSQLLTANKQAAKRLNIFSFFIWKTFFDFVFGSQST